MKKQQIIAEVKIRSPFGYRSKKSWDELFAIANKVGDIISIHTDPRWGGSFDMLQHARSLTEKPILAKGIHLYDDDVERAFQSGANYVLVVGRLPDHPRKKDILIEPNSLEELKSVPPHYKIVWNSRDLNSGGIKSETFEEARALRKGWMCQASNIQTVEDIKPGADAVLVGTHLEAFVRSLGNWNS